MATLRPRPPQDESEALEGLLSPSLALDWTGGRIPLTRDPFQLLLRLVTDAVSSPATKRSYTHSVVGFTTWLKNTGCAFSRQTVQAWKADLEANGASPSTVNVRLAAVRKLAAEAHAAGLLDGETAASIAQIPGAPNRGQRAGNWLTEAQAQALLYAPDANTLRGKRDRVALALLVACGLRRSEAAQLTFEDLQLREGRWVIVDMRGKGGRIRTIPVPIWVMVAVGHWTDATKLSSGRVLRSINQSDQITGESLSDDAIYDITVKYGKEIGVSIAAHDLRRTCAKLCRRHGGALEQIQLLLGHSSIETTQRYLGTIQDLVTAPNDCLDLNWEEE